MVKYSNSEFAMMLMLLQNSQSAIQSLSTWCLKHHEHYKSIIIIWLNAIRKVKIERRLNLFYLANHVIQNSKKKNNKFVDTWKIAIQKAIPYVRDEKIQFQISRIIKIWEERGVYDVNYLAGLTGLLTTPIQKLKLTNSVQEIQIHTIEARIRNCAKLEQINNSKMKNLTEAILPLTNKESIQDMLKDRTLSHELFNNNMSNIETYIKCLKQEIIDRAQLIDAIEVAKCYYEKKNREMKIVAQEYFNYTKRIKLLKSLLEFLVDFMPIENPMPLSHINVPPPSASSVSTVDSNIHNINDNNVLNSDKNIMNSSMINTINNTDIAALTTAINYMKSNTTPDKYTTVQESYNPASVSFPVIKNQDQQPLTNLFTNDAPSLPPEKTLAYLAFPDQTKINNNNKSSTYSTSSYEAYKHTPMTSSHQFITSESLVNESTMPASHVPQTAQGVPLLNDWTTNDTPASSLLHEKISYQNIHIINKTDGEPEIDQCVLPSKLIDRDVTVSPKTINETSGIEHKNFNSSINPTGMNSLMISDDADCQAFSDFRIPPSPPNLIKEAVSSPLKDNLEIVDMDLSDDDVEDNVESVVMVLSEGDEKSISHQDQKHPVLLPSPLLLMPFYQQNVPDVTYQWKQTYQPWSNNKSNFNENQWNIKQCDQWKHPKQWEQDKRLSNILHNHPYSLRPQNVQRIQSKEYFEPKWERKINIWASRDPRNFTPHSRPTGTQNLNHV